MANDLPVSILEVWKPLSCHKDSDKGRQKLCKQARASLFRMEIAHASFSNEMNIIISQDN